MNDDPPKSSGWFDSFRVISESLVSLLRNRVELLAIEVQEEKLRVLNLCAWFAVAVGFCLGGVLVALAALSYWLWTVAGYWGLILLAAGALGVGVGIILILRQGIKTGPAPFNQTVAEFRKDGESLRGEK